MQEIRFEEALEQIVAADPRYQREAYSFLREALDYTQRIVPKESAEQRLRHVTGQELLEGIRQFALTQFGPMAGTVLTEWGVNNCSDFGNIVFNMVETRLLAKTENDSREDFAAGYDFEEAFRKPYLPTRKLSTAPTETPAKPV